MPQRRAPAPHLEARCVDHRADAGPRIGLSRAVEPCNIGI
jgi:hypothetical protein